MASMHRIAPDRALDSRPTIGVLRTSLVELNQAQWLGAVDGAREQRANLISFVGRELDSPTGFDAQANAIYDLVGAERVDGLAVWATALQLYAGSRRLQEFCRRFEPLPMVGVEQVLPGHPSLVMDNRGGMYKAVSHLIEEHGHRRIAFVRGPVHHLGVGDRYQGYLDALSQHGLPIDPGLIAPPPRAWGPDEPTAWLTGLLDQGVELDALAAGNDTLAAAVLVALDARNVAVPEDVAVVGFDDIIGLSSAIDPVESEFDLGREDLSMTGDALARAVNLSATTLPLTTVRAPFYELGRRAVQLVLAQLRGEPVPELQSIPTKLVVRRSCGCLSHAVEHEPATTVRLPAARGGDDRLTELEREQITARMLESLTVPLATLAPDWADRLLTAFVEAARGETGFLQLLDEQVRISLRAGERLESWWSVLFALRSGMLTRLTGDGLARVETLWLEVQRLLGEVAERFAAYQRLLAQKRNQIMRAAGQRVVTTLDAAQVAEVLVDELPNVGIPSCYLASYEKAGCARAVLVYEHGQRIEVAPEERVFRSNRLVPAERLSRLAPYSLVALPLYFKEQQLGFVLFEVGPRIGWIYEALQEQLSSALEGALLVERERRAAAELEEARRRLERAHDELEERVSERTAELAQANETLTEQIIERERAQEIQARLEEQLRQSQKMEAVGRLAGGIAHDFNNLLVVIAGYSDLLLGKLGAGDPTRADIEQIQRAGERATTLTNQLLAFSRQQVVQPSALSLNGVVANVETMLRRLIGEDVALVTKLAPSLAPVVADRGQLEQIVLNLALNARDAMPQGGRLTIETANVELDEDYARQTVDVEAGAYVLLKVSDTGVGMNEETRARIFEPFFTTKPQGEGTGLGLATVFGIVRQSGGHVGVRSAPGRGSTFEIYLPQSQDAVERRTTEPAPGRSSLHGTETILLVEDDDGVRRAARRFLEEHGYRVLEASQGREALRLSDEHEGRLHLLITDVVMPEMTGRELAEQMTRDRPDTPVLYMSGYADSALVRQELSDSSVSLLQKPFTAGALARRVREVLDRPDGM
jgi:signal transduction histidine kinase/DNA-binding LacI/PurR family transcriptional regulator/CheY-like chemotaxis protein